MKARGPVPIVIAHRGASGYRPEHSLLSYQMAIDLGADAIEPDVVASSDGVLVLRHDNELSKTTDVADRKEFASRRTSKVIDGKKYTGWFTEDFTWAELQRLKVRERLPKLRSKSFDDREGILRLSEVFDLVEKANVKLVVEIKHATYFASIGLPMDDLLANEIAGSEWEQSTELTIECFETTILRKLSARGFKAKTVFLIESSGFPADEVARLGKQARSFEYFTTNEGLTELASDGIDGIGVDKQLLLRKDKAGKVLGVTDLVKRAHSAGLLVYCWTLRAENAFLAKNLQTGGGDRQFGQWREEFSLLMNSGLDGVFADQPDLALEVRNSLK
ncbi:MAG: glycerophosphodiester phosphodiesterase [Microbacteriaceae bacterium]|nr:glycerophosphodiester phosphodiesterase [Cryobacterium sp.]MBX3104293.1 glycerophosphodiester phosphodiesterase [Cryobacterium sp.]MCC6377110.1 glycerophosphodiester phosphodiesterase [Microbacteriaceae bacterium]